MIIAKLQSSVRSGVLRPIRKLGLAVATQWPWPVRCRIRSGQTMYLDLRSTVGRTLFMQGEFDPGVFRPLGQCLQKGDTFLDVGANVGYYSMLALQLVGPHGAVHAFEVDERPLCCLRSTIADSCITNLHLHETAVGDKIGTAYFVREAEAGNSHVVDNGRTSDLEVPMTTLDEWYRESGKPAVRAIKLDVEGGEAAVLAGARQLLTEQRPLVICEAWDGHSVTESRSAALLRELDFSITALPNVHSPCFVATV